MEQISFNKNSTLFNTSIEGPKSNYDYSDEVGFVANTSETGCTQNRINGKSTSNKLIIKLKVETKLIGRGSEIFRISFNTTAFQSMNDTELYQNDLSTEIYNQNSGAAWIGLTLSIMVLSNVFL